MLVPGLVILFVVMRGGSAVGVCGDLVKFRGANVRIFCHCFSVLSSGANLARIHYLSCSIVHRRRGEGPAFRPQAQTDAGAEERHMGHARAYPNWRKMREVGTTRRKDAPGIK